MKKEILKLKQETAQLNQRRKENRMLMAEEQMKQKIL